MWSSTGARICTDRGNGRAQGREYTALTAQLFHSLSYPNFFFFPQLASNLPSFIPQVLLSEEDSKSPEMPWPSRKRDKGAVAGLCYVLTN